MRQTSYYDSHTLDTLSNYIAHLDMELITKPEEKPTYWYIKTSEMKKSEYWEVFKEWFNEKSGDK